MRFEVGHTYTFLRTLYTPGRPSFVNVYIPWEDTLTDIQAINLTCKEHHKVPNEFNPEDKKYDGFVFEGADGGVWYNQYPTASYGQLDDTQDRRVERHFETCEMFSVDDEGEPLKNAEGLLIKRTDAEGVKNYEIWQDMFENPFELATMRLGNIYRAINPLASRLTLESKKREALREHLNALVEKVEATSQQKVIFEPIVLRYTDGRPPEMTTFIAARLSNDPEITKLANKYIPPGAILSRQQFNEQIPLKSKFYRVDFSVPDRVAFDPKLHEADRWFPTGISETGDDKEDELLYFHFRYAGRHFDSCSFLSYNVSRINDFGNSFVFANKKDAEAYVAFILDPTNEHFFR